MIETENTETDYIEISEADYIADIRNTYRKAVGILRHCDDPEDALVWIDNHNYLSFFFRNIDIFRNRGFYEKGLFLALTMANMQETRTNHSVDFILSLLNRADRDKLKACGDVLTTDDPIQVFRGITNRRNTRSIRRPSWTLRPETAAWFAMVCGRPLTRANETSAVFRMMVPPEAIYFYTNHRGEEEVFLNPQMCGPAKQVNPMPTPVKPKAPPEE